MAKPLLLDLFCGAGGAAAGYVRGGFEVVGVDIAPQKHYLLSGASEFIEGDALDFVRAHGHEFDAIHASPPCQHYSTLHALSPEKVYPDLIDATRRALIASGVHWVIENVMTAPLLSGITLCGTMFGLRTYRHRRFESSVLMLQPQHPRHLVRTCTKKRRASWDAGLFISVTGDIGSYVGSQAMGIDWMTGSELSQAIPPAYCEFVGRQLLAAIETARAV